jgi:hypothetical protein
MISIDVVTAVDKYLDDNVSQVFKDQPLAQDFARALKVIEEVGEALSELISFTGQNPRKPQDDSARERFLLEMADAALSLVYGIHHFTKSADHTRQYLAAAQSKHISRVMMADSADKCS